MRLKDISAGQGDLGLIRHVPDVRHYTYGSEGSGFESLRARITSGL